jgi:hypothetical protein
MLRKTIVVVLGSVATAMGVVWALSLAGWLGEQWYKGYPAQGHRLDLYHGYGRVQLAHLVVTPRHTEKSLEIHPTWYSRPNRLGFAWTCRRFAHSSGFPSWHLLLIHIPIWLLAFLAGIYPTIAFVRGPIRRRRRRRRNQCVHCGYDLTGDVSGVCSECGRTR